MLLCKETAGKNGYLVNTLFFIRKVARYIECLFLKIVTLQLLLFFQAKQMILKDSHISLTNEILNGIKLVNWEDHFRWWQ